MTSGREKAPPARRCAGGTASCCASPLPHSSLRRSASTATTRSHAARKPGELLVRKWGRQGDCKSWLRARGAKISARRFGALANDLRVPAGIAALRRAIEQATWRPVYVPEDGHTGLAHAALLRWGLGSAAVSVGYQAAFRRTARVEHGRVRRRPPFSSTTATQPAVARLRYCFRWSSRVPGLPATSYEVPSGTHPRPRSSSGTSSSAAQGSGVYASCCPRRSTKPSSVYRATVKTPRPVGVRSASAGVTDARTARSTAPTVEVSTWPCRGRSAPQRRHGRRRDHGAVWTPDFDVRCQHLRHVGHKYAPVGGVAAVLAARR